MNATIVSDETKRWLFQRLAHHRNARTFLISFVIFVCFLVAGSPQQIAFTLYVFGVVNLNGTYYDWFNVMYFFDVSAVNPFLYGALDKKIFSSILEKKIATFTKYFELLIARFRRRPIWSHPK